MAGGAHAACCVRSVFFYNSMPDLGDSAGFHFFEPRYRRLVQRALNEEVSCMCYVQACACAL